MLTRSGRTFTLWLFLGDMLLTLSALFIARQIRLVLPLGMTLDPDTGAPLTFDIDWTFYALVLIVWVAVFVTLPVYDNRRSLHAIGDAQITLVAVGFAILILAGLAYFFYRDLSRVLFVYFAFIDALVLIVWRSLLRVSLRLRHAAWPGSKRRVLIVGTGPLADEVAARLRAYTWTGLELAGFLSEAVEVEQADRAVLGPLSAAATIVTREHIDEVLIALPLRSQQDMIDLITDLQQHTVSVRVVPDLFDLAFTRAGIDDLDGIPIVSLREPVLTPVQRIVKRGFDLIVASLLSIVGALPMLIIALVIRRDSPGPAIFRQQRVGEQGTLFWMYKFRTMQANADEHLYEVIQRQANGDLTYKHPDDPRVTRVGRWLRRFSLDELPQLWNVLKGDMSLVGPRPELPWLVELYHPWQRRRFAVPQGMTGWWQINGRSSKPMHLCTENDLYYIQNYSLALDIVILWKTISTVIRHEGAF